MRPSPYLSRPAGAILCFLTAIVLSAGFCSCDNMTTHNVTMRDGTELATDVYRTPGAGSAPTVVIRTPYGRGENESTAQGFVDFGYSVASQDIRGRGESGGEFLMFWDDGWGLAQDGFDTVEWAATGNWSNGDTGLWGGSALAITSLLAAGSAPPSLKCAFTLAGTGDLFHNLAYQGGVLREELVVNWCVALGEAAALAAVLANGTDNWFWDPMSLQDRYASVQVPIYHMGGWYDIFTQGTLDAFEGLHNNGGAGAMGRQKLLVGPWNHGGTGGELLYPNSTIPPGEDLRWLAHWLKGEENGIEAEPAVTYYLMGDPYDDDAPGNVWLTADNWPVPSTPTPYYFIDGGELDTAPPAGGDPPAGYLYDPADPVPTIGGPNLFLPAGPYDQTTTLDRADVLVYETPVLDTPLALTGRISARLWVTSSALDTDFTVKLMDVYPDGRAMLVADGILRMRYCEGQDHEVLITPGETYAIEIDLWSTALVFNAGHRVAVAVSSSNAPRFNVNPNTGGPFGADASRLTADQTIYQDAVRPSQIIFPVVPLPGEKK